MVANIFIDSELTAGLLLIKINFDSKSIVGPIENQKDFLFYFITFSKLEYSLGDQVNYTYLLRIILSYYLDLRHPSPERFFCYPLCVLLWRLVNLSQEHLRIENLVGPYSSRNVFLKLIGI